jgi:hypothetical protein
MNRWLAYLHRALLGLPVLSLVLAVLAWLRYGIDIPWFDDWRGYAEGTIDSLDAGYLFRAVNDTMSPVGLALDALAQRHLDGNSIAYQFVSMVTVLGSLLALQWKLLKRVFDNRLQAAVCFSATLLMLQPGSYWGLDNLAYVQALPLVFILWALLLLSKPAASIGWRGPTTALLGLMAGLTYISGAFSAFAAGVTFMVVAALCHSTQVRRQSLRDAAWFTAAAAITVAVQSYYSLFKLRGTHAGGSLALPNDSAFWAFYLGKLARSLLLPPDWPLTAVLVTLTASGIAVVAAVLLLRLASSSSGTDQEKQLVSIFVPLGAVVVVYLMLVAAGRTNLRQPDVDGLLEIFQHGFVRFHFFWATLIWPWVAAAAFLLYKRRSEPGRVRPWGAAALAVVFASLVFEGGGFDHMARQKEIGEGRTTVANCLLTQLQKGREVRCNWLLPPRFSDLVPDSYPAFLYARKIGASFVRQFPMLPLAKRRETITAFYTMDGDAKPRMRELEALGKGVFRAVGGDPHLLIQTHRPEITRRCTTLDVEIDMKASERDTLQLFYVPAGDSDEYSEPSSVKAAVGADRAWQTFVFRLDSPTGFFESLRLDPVTRPQVLEISGIRLYCVWEMP